MNRNRAQVPSLVLRLAAVSLSLGSTVAGGDPSLYEWSAEMAISDPSPPASLPKLDTLYSVRVLAAPSVEIVSVVGHDPLGLAIGVIDGGTYAKAGELPASPYPFAAGLDMFLEKEGPALARIRKVNMKRQRGPDLAEVYRVDVSARKAVLEASMRLPERLRHSAHWQSVQPLGNKSYAILGSFFEDYVFPIDPQAEKGRYTKYFSCAWNDGRLGKPLNIQAEGRFDVGSMQWSASGDGEICAVWVSDDDEDVRILYSVSKGGEAWSTPETLVFANSSVKGRGSPNAEAVLACADDGAHVLYETSGAAIAQNHDRDATGETKRVSTLETTTVSLRHAKLRSTEAGVLYLATPGGDLRIRENGKWVDAGALPVETGGLSGAAYDFCPGVDGSLHLVYCRLSEAADTVHYIYRRGTRLGAARSRERR